MVEVSTHQFLENKAFATDVPYKKPPGPEIFARNPLGYELKKAAI